MLKQFGWLSIGRLLATAIQAATIIILARLIDPSQLGQILSAIGVGIVLQMIFDLGVSTYVLREASVGTRPSLQNAASVHAVSCGILIIFGTILLFTTSALITFEIFIFLPLVISAAADRHSDMRLNILLAEGDSRLNVMLLLERRLLTLTLFLILSNALQLDPAFSFTAAMATASVIALWRTVRATDHIRMFTRLRRESVKLLLVSTRPFWVNSVASQLRNLDAPLVLLGGGSTASGLYGFASRLVNPLRLIPDSVGNVFLPSAAKQPYDIRPFIKLSGGVLLLMTGGLLTIFSIAPIFVPFAAGEEYRGAVLPVQIICAGMFFGTISSVCSPILQGWGETRSVATIAVVTNVTALGLIFVLSGEFGATGAAIALSATFCFQALLLIMQVIRSMRTGDLP